MTEGRVSTDLGKILHGTTTKDIRTETGSFRTVGLTMDCSLTCLKEILATKKAARTFEPPPRMLGNRRPRDMTKYCHFYEDHGHDTNDCHELRHKIEEAVKSGQFSHLVKGIKKGKRKLLEELTLGFREITFPLVAGVNNSFDPVIIKAKIFRRQVNQVYMDSGSSCEVIYEHCFLKLKPSIKSLRVDSKVPLVGFLREHSWPIREVPLEITIGDSPFSRTDTLIFIIIRRMDKKAQDVSLEDIKGILSCKDAEERIIVNTHTRNKRLPLESGYQQTLKK
nr:hypothetical protein [Tanacetum cinerariifolium]